MDRNYLENTRLILEDIWITQRDCLHRFLTAVLFALTILGLDFSQISASPVIHSTTTIHSHGRTRPLPNTELRMMDHPSFSISRMPFLLYF